VVTDAAEESVAGLRRHRSSGNAASQNIEGSSHHFCDLIFWELNSQCASILAQLDEETTMQTNTNIHKAGGCLQYLRQVPHDEYGDEKIDLTIQEAAAYLGISTYMLRKWRKAGDGPVRSCWGNWFYYSRNQLDEWLKAADTFEKGVA